MSRTKAKKKRNHAIRNGCRDVTDSRGGAYISISTHVRRGKTKTSTLLKSRLNEDIQSKRNYILR